MKLSSRVVAAAGALGLGAQIFCGVSARAEGPPPRTDGVIATIKGDSVVIDTRFGSPVTLKLSSGILYIEASRSSLANVKPEAIAGPIAGVGLNGTKESSEVTLFPRSTRGVSKSHRGWDLVKSNAMELGTVGSVTASTQHSMTIGTTTFAVPDGVPTVALQAGNCVLLRKGAQVTAFGPESSKSTVDVNCIVVAENGVVPRT